jgi:hypothetical protein
MSHPKEVIFNYLKNLKHIIFLSIYSYENHFERFRFIIYILKIKK